MGSSDLTRLRLGFVPLIDCAIPVVAHELGFAAQQGIALDLAREASWAGMRDKLAYGVLDAAHLLAGIPLACNLGLGGSPPVKMVAPMALGRGGNGITVSEALYSQMCEADPEAMAGPRAQSARALKAVIAQRRDRNLPQLAFATVFPFSSHNFELRYWLAAAGIDPDKDLNMGVIAPPRMAESLRLGYVDGYCVGEPWSLRAVEQGFGVVVATKADIWPAAPEKVLGLRADWAEGNPDLVQALVRALVQAAQWADQPENHAALAGLLAQDRYVGASAELMVSALRGQPRLVPGKAPEQNLTRHVFYRWQATFPWLSHGHWLLAQMERWGLWQGTTAQRGQVVAEVYRPDLYRHAVAGLGLALPQDDSRVEGGHSSAFSVPALGAETVELGPDAFMDGKLFDPAL